MKIFALFALTALTVTALSATAEPAKKVHCQSDAELTFYGWDTSAEAEPSGNSLVRFMLHTTDTGRALKQTNVTVDESSLCIQQEIQKESPDS
jgi:hypothetical protein